MLTGKASGRVSSYRPLYHRSSRHIRSFRRPRYLNVIHKANLSWAVWQVYLFAKKTAILSSSRLPRPRLPNNFFAILFNTILY